MTTNAEISAAFRDVVNNAALGYPISWQGYDFTPPASGKWLELRHLPNTGLDQSISSSTVLKQGIFQVNIAGRPGGGTEALQNIADTVAALFQKASLIVDNVKISAVPYQSQPIIMDDRMMVGLTIPYSE